MDKRSFLFMFSMFLSFMLVTHFFSPTPKVVPPPTSNDITSPLKEKALSTDESIQTIALSSINYGDEKFYVLENGYQQLVFSNLGGSLAEINLKLHDKNDPQSIVYPIEFDEKIQESFPENDLFPLNSYTVYENGREVTKKPVQGGYTPLLRRSLKNKQGGFAFRENPNNYALNIETDSIEGGRTVYKMSHLDANSIEFTGSVQGRRITKRYQLIANAPYTLKLDVNIEGDSKGLWLTSGASEVEMVTGSYSPLVLSYLQNGSRGSLSTIKLPKNEPLIQNTISTWVSNSNGFLGVIVCKLNNEIDGLKTTKIPGSELPSRITLIDSTYKLYPPDKYPSYTFLLPFSTADTHSSYVVFSGPYQRNLLRQVDQALASKESSVHFNPRFVKAVTIQGWFTWISDPFAKLLFVFLKFFHFITRSWGISIILLTFVLRLILYPLNNWSYQSQLKIQKLDPKIKEIQRRFKGDPRRLQAETAMLYKSEKVNPLSGCLPMLIQIPFLIGMYDLIKSAFDFRGASFIPGWITNLTAPDVLFSWNQPILFFGTSFHLLPFINGLCMYLQGKLSVQIQLKKGPLSEQQKQMQSMSTFMSIFFIYIFYNMPSGLNIYWIFSTLFGILQQWLVTHHVIGFPKILNKK